MKKLLTVLALLLIMILGSCGNDNATDNATEPESDVSAPVSTEPADESDASEEEAKVTEEEKKLDPEEEMALEFIEVYYNGNDVVEMELFIETHVHEDSKGLFMFGVSENNEVKFDNAVVANSIVYKDDNISNGNLVLIEGETGNQAIVLLVSGQIAYVYESDSEGDMKQAFDEMLELF